MICYLLSPRGYCIGIKRAVDMVTQVIKLYGSVYIIEDIIHNKLFINNLLKNGGIIKVNSIDEVPDGSVVMFSSHGVSPDMAAKAEERDITVIDSTCPVVKELQSKVQLKSEEGYSIIIIGNRAHQEVVALLGYVKDDNVYVVNSEMDIDLLPNLVNKKVVYFTQTSVYPGDIKPIIDALKAKIPNIESCNPFIQEPFKIAHNICQDTLDRQNAVRSVANKIDLLIVIGSEESSNALSLVSTGKDNGINKVIRIDSKEELTDEMFEGVNNIGIISAASVAIEIVNDIVDYIKSKEIFTIEEFDVNNPEVNNKDIQNDSNEQTDNNSSNNGNINNQDLNTNTENNTSLNNGVIDNQNLNTNCNNTDNNEQCDDNLSDNGNINNQDLNIDTENNNSLSESVISNNQIDSQESNTQKDNNITNDDKFESQNSKINNENNIVSESK